MAIETINEITKKPVLIRRFLSPNRPGHISSTQPRQPAAVPAGTFDGFYKWPTNGSSIVKAFNSGISKLYKDDISSAPPLLTEEADGAPIPSGRWRLDILEAIKKVRLNAGEAAGVIAFSQTIFSGKKPPDNPPPTRKKLIFDFGRKQKENRGGIVVPMPAIARNKQAGVTIDVFQRTSNDGSIKSAAAAANRLINGALQTLSKAQKETKPVETAPIAEAVVTSKKLTKLDELLLKLYDMKEKNESMTSAQLTEYIYGADAGNRGKFRNLLYRTRRRLAAETEGKIIVNCRLSNTDRSKGIPGTYTVFERQSFNKPVNDPNREKPVFFSAETLN